MEQGATSSQFLSILNTQKLDDLRETHHIFVHDKSQIQRFQSLVYKQEDFQSGGLHQLFILIRKKYGADATVSVGHQMIEWLNEDMSLYKYVRRYETPLDVYTDKQGNFYPTGVMTIYSTLVPRDSHAVVEGLSEKWLEALKNAAYGSKHKMDFRFKRTVTSLISKNILRRQETKRRLYQIDVDTRDDGDINILVKWLNDRKIKCCFVIETRGGYHIVIDRCSCVPKDKITQGDFTNFQQFFKKDEITLLNEADVIQIPGTFSNGYPVRFHDDLMTRIGTID